MTTRTLTGTYASGYVIKLPVTDLIVASTGYVEGGILSPSSGAHAYTIANYGKVKAGALAIGVYLYSGGSLTNGSAAIETASISGAIGVIVGEAAGTVVNFGSIQGVGASSGGAEGNGVILSQGGLVTNGSASDTTALISGATAVATYSHPGIVTNFGTLKSAPAPAGVPVVYLHDGGSLTNGSSKDTSAYIGGSNGQHYLDAIVAKGAAATVTNFGLILADASYVNDGGSLSLYPSTAINLKSGGEVINGTTSDTSANIYGTYGVIINGGAGTVINDGSISSYLYGTLYTPPDYYSPGSTATYIDGVGVTLGDGGRITNGAATNQSAYILGGQFGVKLQGAPGTVQNFGIIEGRSNTSGAGVDVAAGGKVINAAGAVISGFNGVEQSGAGALTVVNYGAINAPHDAVVFTSANDRLILEGGCTFTGGIVGDGGTLELGKGSGAISGIGPGFGAFVVDAGGVWGLAGNNTLSGQKVAVNGTFTLTGFLQGFGVVGGAGAFDLAASGVINTSGMAGLTLESKTLGNAGLMVGVGAGGLTLAATTVANAGTIEAQVGSRVVFKGADIQGGTLLSEGTGLIEISSGVNILDGTAAAVSDEGAIRLLSGAGLTLEGAIIGSGAITLTNAAKAETLTVASIGATLSGGGEISLGNMGVDEVVGASATATLTNTGDRIVGAGQLGGGEMVLVNAVAGVIDGDYAAGLVINTGTRAVANRGIIETTGSGVVTIKSGVSNTGTLEALGGTLTVERAVTGAGTVRITAGTADFISTFSESVTFGAGSTGTLELGKSQSYAGSVTGFSKTGSNALDLADIAFNSGTTKATFSGTTASGVLTVTDGTHTAKIILKGNFIGSIFTPSSDGHGGTRVVDPPASSRAVLFAGQAAAMGSSSAITGPSAQARTTPLTPLLVARG